MTQNKRLISAALAAAFALTTIAPASAFSGRLAPPAAGSAVVPVQARPAADEMIKKKKRPQQRTGKTRARTAPANRAMRPRAHRTPNVSAGKMRPPRPGTPWVHRKDPPTYRGYRGYHTKRPGYSYHNGYWYPLAAFAAGAAIIGGIIATQPSAPPPAARHLPPEHYRWCEDHYRSYRAYDNTFQPYYGPRKQCVSPYY